MTTRQRDGSSQEEELYIVELDSRLEFAAGLIESEDRLDMNVCQANPYSCTPFPDTYCVNAQACC